MGIFTAAELAAAPRALIRRSFGILTEKTLQELNGISCIELEDAKLQKAFFAPAVLKPKSTASKT